MVNSRNKGAAFERAVCTLINRHIRKDDEPIAKRNLDQYQVGGCDIVFRNFAIECKAYKGGSGDWAKEQWWDQACNSATADQIPVLIYKYNNKPIGAVIHGYLIEPSLLPDKSVHIQMPLKELCSHLKIILKNANNI
jgi:hypothetical protein|tara:strand:- start:329 stop:739 length:411 start_codon:yes stop_codon:yes gene_type:complete